MIKSWWKFCVKCYWESSENTNDAPKQFMLMLAWMSSFARETEELWVWQVKKKVSLTVKQIQLRRQMSTWKGWLKRLDQTKLPQSLVSHVITLIVGFWFRHCEERFFRYENITINFTQGQGTKVSFCSENWHLLLIACVHMGHCFQRMT